LAQLDATQLARIEGCVDPARLEAWFDRAIEARDVDLIFAE